MHCSKDTWLDVTESGLINEAVEKRNIVSFEEHQTLPGSWKILKD